MLKATLKGFLAHKFRLALTVLAVVLGVAFVAGTYVLTDTMNRTFDTLFTEAAEGVDVYVRADSGFSTESVTGGDRIPESLLERVAAVEGVEAAEGEVSGYAQLIGPDGEAIGGQAPTLGTSWIERPGLSAISIREGRAPAADGEVAIDVATASKHGFAVGDRVRVLFEGPAEEFEIVGLAGFGSADNLAGATLAVFELRTAQRVLGAEGQLDTIDVVAASGTTVAELRERIAEVLPSGVEAQTGTAVAAEQAESFRENISFFSTTLLVFAAVALFVGAFIIFNTFNILVTQRTRELALMRALGASAGQVTRSVLLEGVLVGLVASGLGILGGLGLAVGLKSLLAAFGLDMPASGLQVLPRTIVVSFVIGVGVTLLASVFPARRAARIAPIAALRETDAVRPVPLKSRSVAGGVLVAIGAVALAGGLFAGDGMLELVGLGVLLTFLGVAVLSPLLSRPLARGIGWPLARLGVQGKLGRENAMRNPRRTAATSSALMIGLALVATFLILGASLKASIGKTIDESFRADYMLTSNTGMMASFSPMVGHHLEELPEIAIASPMRLGQWREPGASGTQFLNAIDPARIDAVLKLDMQGGSVARLAAPDTVMLHERVAESTGLAVGDRLRMEFPAKGAREMEVVGIFGEAALTSDALISLESYERLYTEQLDYRVLVKAEPGVAPPAARAAVEKVVGAHPNVELQDQAQLRASQERMVDQLLAMVSVLLGLAVVIALLGIVNTLALSVLERTRELGLLRAVGMSRGQVRGMVRSESVIIGLLGGVLGVAVGAFFGWALVAALAAEGFDRFAFPAGQLAFFLLLAGFAGVLAGVLPARRAAKLDVLRAIGYE